MVQDSGLKEGRETQIAEVKQKTLEIVSRIRCNRNGHANRARNVKRAMYRAAVREV